MSSEGGACITAPNGRAGKGVVSGLPSFYEFFAGGGMVRAGLGIGWKCLLANDIDEKKAASYAENWGADQLRVEDVGRLLPLDVPARAELAWASFPCQDLSLAGDYAGLKGARSGTFWLFWELIKGLAGERRAPKIIALENVCGALTSHGGDDFAAIGSALAEAGYRFGAMVVDAVRFVPQSRPRLFIIAIERECLIPAELQRGDFDPHWHPSNLVSAYSKLSEKSKAEWIWWSLPVPPARATRFADIIEDDPCGVEWHTASETKRLLGMMSPVNRKKIQQAKRMGGRVIGGVYKRTRLDDQGNRVQRAEVRFDDIAGCLRTPSGGSSRQTIVIVEGDNVRSRLLSPREAARLMGLAESYKLPKNYNEAYHLAGDGVAVPVVRYLAAQIFEPLLRVSTEPGQRAA